MEHGEGEEDDKQVCVGVFVWSVSAQTECPHWFFFLPAAGFFF